MIVGLVIGFVAGGCFGVIVMSLLAASAYGNGRDDERAGLTAYDRELARRGIK